VSVGAVQLERESVVTVDVIDVLAE